MREANTGCASVGLAPMIMTTSVCSTESKSWVPAEVPKVVAQAVAGRRMADAGAGIDIVVAEAGADQLLHQIGFFVGAAGRGDAADGSRGRIWPGCRLNSAAAIVERLVPRHFAPGIGDLLADHRIEDALLVGGVAPGETALDAGMAAIGLAVLVRHHAHHFLAAHFRLEGAADAAIGAGRHHRMLGLADLDHGFLGQRRGRTGLHAGAAGHAFGAEKTLAHAGRNPAVEAAAGNGQREGALHFLAGADAARADDAFRGVVGEIGIGFVLRHPGRVGRAVGLGEHMVLALIAVAHVAQADRARHVLQFAVAIGRTGQAVQRMVGDVELHHALAQLLQPLGLGVDHEARASPAWCRKPACRRGLRSRSGTAGRSRTRPPCRWRRVSGSACRPPSPRA